MPVPEASDEAFDFNDRSQQPAAEPDRRAPDSQPAPAPKAKRIACILCRKRKLKCDGQRPSCGTCKRLAHDCAYDEVRKKSGPKRGYVKALEARLRMFAAAVLRQVDLELNNARRQNKSRRSSRPRNPPSLPGNRDQAPIQIYSRPIRRPPRISTIRMSPWMISPTSWTTCFGPATAFRQANFPPCRLPPSTTAPPPIPFRGK